MINELRKAIRQSQREATDGEIESAIQKLERDQNE
jgi:hypothetical protein